MKKRTATLLIMMAIITAPGCDGAFDDLYNSIINEDTVAPQQVVMTGITEDQAQISFKWTDPDDSDFDHIEITCRETSGTTAIAGNTVARGTGEYTQNDLTPETDYSFAIRTVDFAGNRSAPVNISVTTTATTATTSRELEILYTAEELAAVDVGDNTILMADVDLEGDQGEVWTPIGDDIARFTGTFNGNGHTIRNMTINQPSSSYQGFFGYIGNGAKVRDMVLENVNVEGGASTGSLAGRNLGEISGCHASGTVTGASNSPYAGGLVGYNVGPISDCSAGIAVEGGNDTGGLVGYNDGKITDCRATGRVTGHGDNTGGLAGWNSTEGTITNCSASGEVTGEGDNTGGLVGQKSGWLHITGSYASGKVTGTANTGGLVGYLVGQGKISDCHATGTSLVKGTTAVGGLVGYNYLSSGEISDCSATCPVTGTGSYTGGLIGHNQGTAVLSDCFAEGTVTGAGYTGGLVGFNDNNYDMFDCYATGDVEGTSSVGGLVGSKNGTGVISGCYAEGSVTGTGNTIGGLVGFNSTGSSIINCYARGNVRGEENMGGLVGDHDGGSITNCFATGYVSDITGNDDLGGLVGEQVVTGSVNNSFYDSVTTGYDAAGGAGSGWTAAGIAKITEDMTDEDIFTDAGWDFTGETDNGTVDIWSISNDVNGGYPYLTGN